MIVLVAFTILMNYCGMHHILCGHPE